MARNTISLITIFVFLLVGTVCSFKAEAETLTISDVSPSTYTVKYNSLAVGQLVYIDRTYTFTNVASLGGSTYIKTANNDKNSSGSSFLTFNINQNCTVYVSHSDRIATKPSWLSSFVDTGENLVTSDAGNNLSLYVRDFNTGTVTLGGNEGVMESMYSVVVVPQGAQARFPSPANGAGGIGVEVNLSWTAGSGATSHNVYFGTSSPGIYQGNQASVTFEPGTMEDGETYYWRIDEVNAYGTATGAVWNFTTGGTAIVKIMPLGDSITQGYTTYDNYRHHLWDKLQSYGYNNVNFVGSHDVPAYDTYDSLTFDKDYEGHYGWHTNHIITGGGIAAGGTGNLTTWLTGLQAAGEVPDIVLMHLGTNDVTQNPAGYDQSITIGEMEDVIDILRSYNPNVTVLLAKIIPHQNGALPSVDALNALIPGLDSYETATSEVIIVDHYTGFLTSWLVDDYHPNTTGATEMSNRWFNALLPILGQNAIETVGRWKLDETSGSTAYDSSGNGNNGTLVNMDDSDWVSGMLNGALDFDGVDDYVQINNTNDLPIIPEGSDFAISVWIKLDNVSGSQAIYGHYSISSFNYWAYCMCVNDGDFRFFIGNGTACPCFFDLDNGENLTTARWYHLAVVFDGGDILGYVDGILRDQQEVTLTGTYPKAGSGTKRELIGAAYAGAHCNFDGEIDEVKVWTSTLSAQEVAAEYEAGFGTKSGTINAKDYGAEGDGVTDDSEAIQNAIDAANSEGKAVLLDNGIFLVNSTIMMKPFTDLVGQNATLKNGTMNAQTTDGATLLLMDDKCDVKDLVIDGNEKGLYGIKLPEYTVDVNINNCTIQNFRQNNKNVLLAGVYIRSYCDNITVESSIIKNLSADNLCRGIKIGQVNDTIIDDCEFRNIETDKMIDADCVHVGTSNNNPYNDPNIQAPCHWEPSDVAVKNCRFFDFTHRAVKFQNSGGVIEDNIIASCDALVAIQFFGDDTIVRGNNLFLYNTHGISAVFGNNGTIEGNTIEIFADTTEPAAVLLYREPNNILIDDNIIISTHKALWIYEGATNCEFINNVLDVDPDDAIEISGTGSTSNTVTIPNIYPWDSDTYYYCESDPSTTLYNNNVYQCIQSHQNQEPPNASYWDFVESVDFTVSKIHNIDSHIWYTTIQDAIDAASSGDEIVVYPGVYGEDIVVDKIVTLRSLDPDDWDVVRATINRYFQWGYLFKYRFYGGGFGRFYDNGRYRRCQQ